MSKLKYTSKTNSYYFPYIFDLTSRTPFFKRLFKSIQYPGSDRPEDREDAYEMKRSLAATILRPDTPRAFIGRQRTPMNAHGRPRTPKDPHGPP